MPGDDEVVGEFSLPSIIANAFALLEGELVVAGLSRSICRWVTIASKRSFSIFNWTLKRRFYCSFFWSFGLKSEIKQRRLNINCWYGRYRMSVLLFCVLSSFIFFNLKYTDYPRNILKNVFTICTQCYHTVYRVWDFLVNFIKIFI